MNTVAFTTSPKVRPRDVSVSLILESDDTVCACVSPIGPGPAAQGDEGRKQQACNRKSGAPGTQAKQAGPRHVTWARTLNRESSHFRAASMSRKPSVARHTSAKLR